MLFRCSGCRNWVPMAFWNHETWHYRVHQSRLKTSIRKKRFSHCRSPKWKHHFIEIKQNAFFECPEWRIGAIRIPKTALKQICPNRIFNSQNLKNAFEWPFLKNLEKSFHGHHIVGNLRRSHGTLFLHMVFRLLKTSLKKTSPKSLCSTISLQKMSSYGLLTPWNIALSTSPKSFLRHPEGRLWILRSISLLKTSLHRIRPKRIFESPEWR
jgi:hypothetical protein